MIQLNPARLWLVSGLTIGIVVALAVAAPPISDAAAAAREARASVTRKPPVVDPEMVKPIHSASEMRKYADRFKTDGSIREERGKRGISHVLAVLDLAAGTDLCLNRTGDHFAMLESNLFGVRFGSWMPDTVERYARGLAYEVSAYCKMSLLKNMDLALSMLPQRAIELMSDLDKRNVLLVDKSLDLTGTDPLRFYVDLKPLVQESRVKTPSPVTAWLSDSTMASMIATRRFCTTSIKPMFGNLFGTLETLLSIGYDYDVAGKLMEKERDAYLNSKQLRQWTNMALLCDVLETQPLLEVDWDEHEPEPPVEVKSKLPSLPMPDELTLKTDADQSAVKLLAIDSAKQSVRLRNQIYEKVSKIPFSLASHRSGDSRVFVQRYLQNIDKCMTAGQTAH